MVRCYLESIVSNCDPRVGASGHAFAWNHDPANVHRRWYSAGFFFESLLRKAKEYANEWRAIVVLLLSSKHLERAI